MKKYITLIPILLILLFGCYSKEEKQLAKKYREQGKINALNYIKEKYGFKAKIVSIKEEKICNNALRCTDSTPSENIIVKFKKNNKIFSVYTNGKNNSNEAIDDYQIDNIKKDLYTFLKNNISLTLYDYKIQFNDLGIKEYYNNNINDMMKYISNIELYYVTKEDLNKLNLEKIQSLLKNDTHIKLITFKNKKDCNDYKNDISKNDIKHLDSAINIYKDSMLDLYHNNKNFYKYDNITTYNNKIFVYSPNTNNKYEISTSKLSELKNYKKLYKDLNYKTINQISKAYEINRPNELLYFYFPKSNLKIEDNERVFMVYECYIKGEKQFFISSYYDKKSDIKISNMSTYYLENENLSVCDFNTKVIFSLIKVGY